jgi:hypothetical protein
VTVSSQPQTNIGSNWLLFTGEPMTKPSRNAEHPPPKPNAEEILRDLPYNLGFHFFRAIGVYTGETAISLRTFAAKVEVIEAESVKFHFQRKDFGKWIRETIGDAELASRIDNVNEEYSENQRREILKILRKRIAELEKSV